MGGYVNDHCVNVRRDPEKREERRSRPHKKKRKKGDAMRTEAVTFEEEQNINDRIGQGVCVLCFVFCLDRISRK